MDNLTTEVNRLRRLVEEAAKKNAELQAENAELQARSAESQTKGIEAQTEGAEAQTLLQYLDTCHALDLSKTVVTDRSSTTQGDTTNPVGRICPRRIIPWSDFDAEQQAIWAELSKHPDFFTQKVFPSQHQCEYIKTIIRPISSESGLRQFEHDVVGNAVQKLVNAAYELPALRRSFGLGGTVTFEDHLNLGEANGAALESAERTSNIDRVGRTAQPSPAPSALTSAPASTSTPRPRSQKPRRVAVGKGGNADEFCVYNSLDGAKIPTIAIEYKAPHKLSLDEMLSGLESEIEPERDVVQADNPDPAKAVVAAVVTQLFSYMVKKGIRYGYICTGQAFCFLHIPDDPATVYYALCVPSMDVRDDGVDNENRPYLTAVAQVFAFLLQALPAVPPAESWYDEAEKLKQWDEKYEDVLSKIPLSDRKRKAPLSSPSPYKPRRWEGFERRSPIETRSSRRRRCKSPSTILAREEEADDEEDSGGHPISPTPNSSAKAKARSGGSNRSRNRDRRVGQQRGQRQQSTPRQTHRRDHDSPQGASQPRIGEQPFCTHQCLLGLTSGGPLDQNCPNVDGHGDKHMALEDFPLLIKKQLATQRDSDSRCVPLFLSGARGALFKVQLTEHGYTFIAKGVEHSDHGFLRQECDVYHELRSIQGKYVPVCLGMVESELPRRSDGRRCTSFLFLSWCGKPFHSVESTKEKALASQAIKALKAIHKQGILHGDAALRNMMYDPKTDMTMVVDFDRSHQEPKPELEPKSTSISRSKSTSKSTSKSKSKSKSKFKPKPKSMGRRPLSSINTNSQSRKRKHPGEDHFDDFEQELGKAQVAIDQWLSPSQIQDELCTLRAAKLRRISLP